jgi:hypothetical protein
MQCRFSHAILFILIFLVRSAFAQQFGNEWIVDQQQYYKIPVAKTGIYQVTRTQLQTAGVPVSKILSGAFQLYRNGKEEAIEVSGESRIALSDSGYIRFYGVRNDGANDSALYTSPVAMPHSYYSLYCDTTFYFLTWKLDGSFGKRVMHAAKPKDTSALHNAESLQLYTSHYHPGTFYPKGSGFETGSVLSDYDTGEGWTGPEMGEGESFEIKVLTENLWREKASDMKLEILLAGWKTGLHSFSLWLKKDGKTSRKLADVVFEDEKTYKISLTFSAADLDSSGALNAILAPMQSGGHISVSYIKLNYPQKPDSKPPLIQKIKEIRPVHFDKTDFDNCDYLIITHPLMRIPVGGHDPVEAYASYRASAAGGSYKPLILNIATVFDQFNDGQPGPLGIKNLIAWLSKKANLKFVLLIGRSIDPQKARKSTNPREADMVPNAGWPGSDIALTTSTDSGYPQVPIGRINATSSAQVWDYLQKVKAMEAEPISAAWRKNLLHLSGGRSRQELSVFREYVKGFEQKIINSGLGASVRTISKETDDPVEKLPVDEPVNKGVALLTIFGHSGLDVTDIDIGSARQYHNHPFYPAVIVNGCAAGSIFYSAKTLSSDWIFSPESGAVLFLAHTFNGVSTALKRYTDFFYEVLADPAFTSEAFGTIQLEALRRNLRANPSIYDRITIQQMNLHGDPAIRIFPARLPDYTIDSASVQLLDKTGAELSPASDSILISLVVKNNGRYLNRDFDFSFRLLRNNEVLSSYHHKFREMQHADTLQFIIPNDKKLFENDLLEFVIDEKNLVSEENEKNNRMIIRSGDLKNNKTQIDQNPPLLYVKMNGRELTNEEYISPGSKIEIHLFDFETVTPRKDTTGIVIWLKPVCDGCEEKRLYLNEAKWRSEDPKHFCVETKLPQALLTGKYLLTVRAREVNGNFAPDYEISFRITENSAIESIEITPNPSSKAFIFKVGLTGLHAPEKLDINITNLAGQEIAEIQMNPHIGLNSWIWQPANLTAGVYLYKITISNKHLSILPEVGSKLSGRLLWFP